MPIAVGLVGIIAILGKYDKKDELPQCERRVAGLKPLQRI
jgi:hypothetical protein